MNLRKLISNSIVSLYSLILQSCLVRNSMLNELVEQAFLPRMSTDIFTLYVILRNPHSSGRFKR